MWLHWLHVRSRRKQISLCLVIPLQLITAVVVGNGPVVHYLHQALSLFSRFSSRLKADKRMGGQHGGTALELIASVLSFFFLSSVFIFIHLFFLHRHLSFLLHPSAFISFILFWSVWLSWDFSLISSVIHCFHSWTVCAVLSPAVFTGFYFIFW